MLNDRPQNWSRNNNSEHHWVATYTKQGSCSNMRIGSRGNRQQRGQLSRWEGHLRSAHSRGQALASVLDCLLLVRVLEREKVRVLEREKARVLEREKARVLEREKVRGFLVSGTV
jgi:hypothetical protein